jgi:ribosomal protein S18 acetylase RimI-like enzyme
MIREFETADMDNLIALVQQHFDELGDGVGTYTEHKLISMIRNQHIKMGREFILAEKDGGLKGYALCSVMQNAFNHHREGTIIFYYIDPAYRQDFIAKDLLAGVENYFRKYNCTYFTASTKSFNADFKGTPDATQFNDDVFASQMDVTGKNYIKEIE